MLNTKLLGFPSIKEDPEMIESNFDEKKQYRFWKGTYFPKPLEFWNENNIKDIDVVSSLRPKFDDLKNLRYAIYQFEKCPSTGNYHFQIFIQLISSRGHMFLIKFLKCWWRPTAKKQSFKIMKGYCSKIETRIFGPWEFGTPCEKERKRTDLTEFRNNIASTLKSSNTTNQALRKLFEIEPTNMIKYGNAAREYIKIHRTRDDSTPFTEFTLKKLDPEMIKSKAIWLRGCSDLGKSAYALSHFKKPLLIRKIEELDLIGDETDGLVFDDATFDTWILTDIMALLNINRECYCDYAMGSRNIGRIIPKGMPRIFTHNENPFFIEDEKRVKRSQVCAILKLLIVFDLDKHLFDKEKFPEITPEWEKNSRKEYIEEHDYHASEYVRRSHKFQNNWEVFMNLMLNVRHEFNYFQSICILGFPDELTYPEQTNGIQRDIKDECPL